MYETKQSEPENTMSLQRSGKQWLVMMSLLVSLVAAGTLCAQTTAPRGDHPTPMPKWEQLTPAQQEMLLAPVRERWNDNPEERQRMFDHAQRWRTMTPEQRSRAHAGMDRWHHMDPEQRAQARVLFRKMHGMTPEQKTAFRAKWKTMSADERHAWMQDNAPER